MRTKLNPIEKYTLSLIDFDGYDNKENTAKHLLDTCFDEYSHLLSKTSKKRIFKEWASGLPSCFNNLFYYDDVNKFLSDYGYVLTDDDGANFDNYLGLLYETLVKLSLEGK